MPPPLRLKCLPLSVKLCCEGKVTIGYSRGQIGPAITHNRSSHSPLFTPSRKTSDSNPASSSSSYSFFSTTTAPHLKKGAPKAQKKKNTANLLPEREREREISEIDPDDFADLEAKLQHQVDWLRERLGKLIRSGSGSGGRLGAETIEDLYVQVKKKKPQHGGGRSSGGGGGEGEGKGEGVRLGELATVVPRGGRFMDVLVNEHLKPIISALQSCPYSLPTPTQPDAQNPLQLSIAIPSPTAESRARSRAAAKTEFESASGAVREARAQWQKWYRRAERERLVRPDELEKAHRRMEGLVEKAQKAVREVYDRAVKGMER